MPYTKSLPIHYVGSTVDVGRCGAVDDVGGSVVTTKRQEWVSCEVCFEMGPESMPEQERGEGGTLNACGETENR